MNTGCFKCDKAQWDADGCTCEITGLLVGNAEERLRISQRHRT